MDPSEWTAVGVICAAIATVGKLWLDQRTAMRTVASVAAQVQPAESDSTFAEETRRTLGTLTSGLARLELGQQHLSSGQARTEDDIGRLGESHRDTRRLLQRHLELHAETGAQGPIRLHNRDIPDQ